MTMPSRMRTLTLGAFVLSAATPLPALEPVRE